MIKQVEGNLVTMFRNGDFDMIIHGCNCCHTMGAGIAKEISNFFPQALYADVENTINGDIKKLSNYTSCAVGVGDGNKMSIIVNLYTQYYPGPDLNMAALELGLFKLALTLKDNVKIGLPYIGAGIAGGDWEEIEPLIERYLDRFDVTIVKFKK